jgi:hypothetical protein
MTDKEILRIINVLIIYYPSAYKDFTEEQMKLMVSLWKNKFNKYNYKEMATAIERISSKNKFCPSVAEILEELSVIRNPELQIDIDEEWDQVIKVIRKYGSYKEDEGLSELKDITNRAVRLVGWKRICMTEDIKWIKKEFVSIMESNRESIKNSEVINEPYKTISELKKPKEIT